MEKLFDHIERYLTGSMQGEELADFRHRLEQDANLAREVQLHERLHKTLGDPDEHALRETLRRVGRDFEQQNKGQSGKKSSGGLDPQWLILALLLGGFLMWWLIESFTGKKENVESPPAEDGISITEQPKTQIPADDTLVTTKPDNTVIDRVPATPPKTVPANPASTSVKIDPFAPQATLEELIKSAGTPVYDFDLTAQTFTEDNGRRFEVLGTLFTVALPESGLTLSIYGNDQNDYPDQPLLNTSLQTTLQTGDEPVAFAAKKAFNISFVESMDVKPGRYYYVIRLEETIIAVGVFEGVE